LCLGLGYIGLPAACLLATHGYQVIGIEPKKEVRDKVNKSEPPFEEPGLEQLLKEAVKLGNLTASPRVEPADAFLIATPTPLEKDTKIADLTYVRQAAESIAGQLRKENTVILESTVPPGTCETVLAAHIGTKRVKGRNGLSSGALSGKGHSRKYRL